MGELKRPGSHDAAREDLDRRAKALSAKLDQEIALGLGKLSAQVLDDFRGRLSPLAHAALGFWPGEVMVSKMMEPVAQLQAEVRRQKDQQIKEWIEREVRELERDAGKTEL